MRTLTIILGLMIAVSLASDSNAQRQKKDGNRQSQGQRPGGQDPGAMAEKMLSQFDQDGDQKLNTDELTAMFTAMRDGRGRAGQGGQQGRGDQQGRGGQDMQRGQGQQGRGPQGRGQQGDGQPGSNQGGAQGRRGADSRSADGGVRRGQKGGVEPMNEIKDLEGEGQEARGRRGDRANGEGGRKKGGREELSVQTPVGVTPERPGSDK